MNSPETQQRSRQHVYLRRPWLAPAHFLRAFLDATGEPPAPTASPGELPLPLQRAREHGGTILLQPEPEPMQPGYFVRFLRLLRFTATGAVMAGLLSITALLSLVVVPSAFGYQALIIHGGSMGGEMPNGSLVLTRQTAAEDVAIGDVILIQEPTESGPPVPKIHRVEALRRDGGNIAVRTRGDANESSDPGEYILPARVLTPEITLLHMGRIIGFVATPTGWTFFILLPALLAAASTIHGIWFPPRRGAPTARRNAAMGAVHRDPWIGSLFALVISAGLIVPIAVSVFSEAPGVAGNAFTADTLNAPTALGATGGASVDLSWTATSDTYAAGHRVYRGSASGGPYSQIAEITPRTTTTYNDAPAAGTYYYVVRAYYQSWESADSNEVSATVP